MARPHKQTVDYFPHDTDASDGKTLTIIQAKYGNDGYAFWFKLLQLLGKTPGHYYDFNKPADWEFLLAKTHQNDAEKAKGILEMLVVLGAIDAELYAHGVIWCQKFVDRLEDVYNRTAKGPPKRPDFLVNVGNGGVSVNKNPKNATKTPQTKLNKTKLNNIYIVLFNLWNELGIITHKKLTSDMKRAIDSARQDYSQEEMAQAMRNYAVIVKGTEYYFDHRWTLAEFLSRRKGNNIERFLDLDIAKSNFKKEAGHETHRQDSRKFPKAGEYETPEEHFGRDNA